MAFDPYETLKLLREELSRVTAAIAALEKLTDKNRQAAEERPQKHKSVGSGEQ
jgi:hypothetical protein